MTISPAMTDITLTLPQTLLEQAHQAAQILQRPVEDVLTDMLKASLPDVNDVPPGMRAELTAMIWLSETELWSIAHSIMSEDDQTQLQHLSKKQAQDNLSDAEKSELEALRQAYGQITLRKAHAYALLSLRGGKPLLAESALD